MFLARRTLLICISLAIIAQSNGQEDNKFDLVQTYISSTEKIYQAFSKFSDRVAKIKHGPVAKDANSSFSDFLNKAESISSYIMPGTLWCGVGNTARNDNELGRYKDTDACCRAHDNCSETIVTGKSRERLLNNGAFTRSACSCDLEFYHCLKNVDNYISTGIGKTYFTHLRPQCFQLEYPVVECLQFHRFLFQPSKCLEWSYDKTLNKTLQWFDTPDF